MIFRALLLIALSFAGTASWAQLQTIRTGSILVLDQATLFTGSKLGQAILALEQTEQDEIFATSNILTQELEAEEAELTQLRETLSNEDFRLLADAFNDKVEAVRLQQSNIDEAQKLRAEARRRAFFQAVLPQLGGILQKYGAAIIMDRRSVLLIDKNFDITLEAIALIDQAFEENPDMIDLGN